MSLHVLSPQSDRISRGPSCLSIVKHFTPIAIADATREPRYIKQRTTISYPHDYAGFSPEYKLNPMHEGKWDGEMSEDRKGVCASEGQQLLIDINIISLP